MKISMRLLLSVVNPGHTVRRGAPGFETGGRGRWTTCCLIALSWAGSVGLLPGAAGAARSTQTFELRAGWNAVALNIAPDQPVPETLLAGTPVELVASHIPESKPVFFPSNPADHAWQKEGWLVWYAPNRPDAFASTLNQILGGRSYLVYSAQAFRWTVAGWAAYQPVRWRTEAFTLTGLPVDDTSPPTFARFFDPSGAHRGQRYFQLIDGRWSLVREPDQTRIKRGEAYWIYSRGGSTYQGPLEVSFGRMTGEIEFRGVTREVRLDFRNLSAWPLSVSLSCDNAIGSVPLAYKAARPSENAIDYPDLPGIHTLPELAPAGTAALRLRVRENALTTPTATTVLHVTDGQGTRFSIPINATRDE